MEDLWRNKQNSVYFQLSDLNYNCELSKMNLPDFSTFFVGVPVFVVKISLSQIAFYFSETRFILKNSKALKAAHVVIPL